MEDNTLHYFVHDPTDEIVIMKMSDVQDSYSQMNLDYIGECKLRTVAEFKSLVSPNSWILLKMSDKDLADMIKPVSKFQEPVKTQLPKAAPGASLMERRAIKTGLQIVTVYTDGSANAVSKLGGIGVFMSVKIGGKTYESRISKGYSHTKIGRMELMAVITALHEIAPAKRATTQVRIYSDSMYAVNCIKAGWLWKWAKEYGGIDSRVNGDVLKKLMNIHDAFPKGNILINHVKGHATSEGNIEADRLAGNAYRSGEYEQDQK